LTRFEEKSCEMRANATYMWANIALAAAQVAFGIGSVIGDLGLPNTNPVLFGLVREGIAGENAFFLLLLPLGAFCQQGLSQWSYDDSAND
jgi:hypothetical protein